MAKVSQLPESVSVENALTFHDTLSAYNTRLLEWASFAQKAIDRLPEKERENAPVMPVLQTGVGNIVTRFSSAQRVTNLPKWLASATLYELTNGKHGAHALHMAPDVAIGILKDEKVKKAEKITVSRIMLAHPDTQMKRVFIPIIDDAIGKDERGKLSAEIASRK